MALTQVKTPGLADGTDGQIITYDANGKATTVGPGSDGQVLTSTGAGSPPAFENLPASGVTVSNNANNRVVTGDGSNLNAEANLTFDGSTLTASGNVFVGRTDNVWNSRLIAQEDKQGRTQILVKNDTDHADASSCIALNAHGNSWVMDCGSGAKNSNALTLGLDASGTPSERVRITTGGQVSIRGTTTAFDTTGDLDSLQLYYETDSGQASIGPYSSGGSTYLSFYTNASAGAATEKVRITSDGKVGIGNNSPAKTLTVGTTTPSILLDDGNSRTVELVGGSTSTNPTLQTTYNSSLYFGTNSTARYYIDTSGHFIPNANNTYDLGSSSNGFRNIYTNDLNLSNEGSTNSVDGTWGSFTIQEGEDDLFLINRRNGKKYKFQLTEVS